MSSLLYKKVITEFYKLQGIENIKSFFERYDIMIFVVPAIRLKNKKIWNKLWDLVYELQVYDEYDEFINILKTNNLLSLDDFLIYMDGIFNSILSGNITFSPHNDLSIVFSNKPLEELLCFCKTINIHSNKNTKEFTRETCIETIYYYRATKENKLYEKIIFNQMMRDICISFLYYLEEIKK